MNINLSRYNLEDNTDLKPGGKTLPNNFDTEDKNFWKFILVSLIVHPLAIFGFWLIFMVLMLLGLHNPLAKKPEWQTKDIEFVLTQNEADPINKNTRFRSDKNSRAGGKHDPSKTVSMPSPSPSPAPKQVSQPAQPVSKPAQQPVQQPKVAQAPKPAPAQPAKPAPSKPAAPAAPVQKPVLKPSGSTPKPQMPKLTQAPSSPFAVSVPNTGAPVGKGFSTSQGTSSTGGSTGGQQGSKGTSSGMPAPQFSTTRTSSAGGSASGTSTGSGRGGYGTGNMGNPGPGNPSGAPGIDAIKSPQWGPYMRELESKIKRNWNPPKGDQSKRVVLLFKIGRRGELLSVKVLKPSGSQANDQAAVTAVQMSAPYRALPPEFTGSSIEIEFTFDYNVLGASYR